ncbi:MAG: SDR family NAD(P)-dependent oxidoreductase [Candidatus Binatia bacterium]
MFADTYGPWALIAGASEGIGASFAAKIARQGVNLVLLARKPRPLDDLAHQLHRSTGVQLRAASLDLSGADLKERLRQLTADVQIGMLVYNAGAESKMAPFLDRPMDQLMTVIRVNVIGATMLLHHFVAPMRQRRRGGIIVVGSMGGFAGGSRLAVYTASKAYQQMLTETLWWELRPFGINVLLLVVGVTKTPAMARMGVNLEGAGQPVMEPDDVAQEGLDNLENGPTWVVGAHNRQTAKLLCTPDRKAAVAMLSASNDAMG